MRCIAPNNRLAELERLLAVFLMPPLGKWSSQVNSTRLRTNGKISNAVELIVSILALFKNEIVIVQTSLIGSILSNLLLVMGMSFFVGGVTRMEQNFNVTVAQTASSLLALAVGSLIIPTAFHTWSGSMLGHTHCINISDY